MYNIHARNVSEALWLGKQLLEAEGRRIETRNGPALEMPWPVCTTYTHPHERVMFYPERDANPFFHFFESLWMLAGRNDVEFVQRFNGRINTYSDDGVTFHGAYGYRWRNYFGPDHDCDQLKKIVHRLKTYPNDRRAVLTMWSPWCDLRLDNDGKDYPCNTHAYFSVREGKLDMMVCCRSNDMIWGAYGANAVHMSYLHEYVASMVGVQMGRYMQMSYNFHAYLEPLGKLAGITPDYDPYAVLSDGSPVPLITAPHCFDEELEQWMKGWHSLKGPQNQIFPRVATPMYLCWCEYKDGDVDNAIEDAVLIQDPAWRRACVEWLKRRFK